MTSLSVIILVDDIIAWLVDDLMSLFSAQCWCGVRKRDVCPKLKRLAPAHASKLQNYKGGDVENRRDFIQLPDERLRRNMFWRQDDMGG